MKELELKPSVVHEQNVPGIEQKYLTTIKRVKGHQFFELNLETGVIEQVKLQHDGAYRLDGSGQEYKVFCKKYVVFVQALNLKNAIKVFIREGYINAQQEVIFDYKKEDSGG